MNLKQSPYFWSLLNRFLQQGLSFINTMILAHFLTPDDFGKIGMLAILTTIGTTIADSGMGGSLIKEKSLTNQDCSTVFIYNLICSVVLYILFFISAPYIALFYNIPQLTSITRVICLPIVINAITIVPRSLLMKELKFDKICKVSIIATIIAMTSAIALAVNGWGVWSLVAYYVVDAVVINLGYQIVCKYMPKGGFCYKSFVKLFSFGFFTTLSNVVDSIYENILSVLLGKYMTATDVGYYSQAKKIEEVPSKSICLTVTNVAFPQLSKLINEKELFIKQAKMIQNNLLIGIAPIMLVLSLYSESIIKLFFGKQWVSAAPYLSILCFAGIFHMIEQTNRTFIKAQGKSQLMFWLSIVKRTIGFILIFTILIVDVNYVLWAYVLASFLCAFINTIAVSRIIQLKIKTQICEWIKILLPLIIIYIISTIWFTNYLMSDLASIVYAIIILFVYYIFLELLGIRSISLLIKTISISSTSNKYNRK